MEKPGERRDRVALFAGVFCWRRMEEITQSSIHSRMHHTTNYLTKT